MTTIIVEFLNEEGDFIGLWNYAASEITDKANRIKLYLYTTDSKSTNTEKDRSYNVGNTSKTPIQSRDNRATVSGSQAKSEEPQSNRIKISRNTSKTHINSHANVASSSGNQTNSIKIKSSSLSPQTLANSRDTHGSTSSIASPVYSLLSSKKENSSTSVDSERLLMNFKSDFNEKLNGNGQSDKTTKTPSCVNGSERNKQTESEKSEPELNIFGNPVLKYSFLQNDSGLKRQSDPLHDRLNMPPPEVIPIKQRRSLTHANKKKKM